MYDVKSRAELFVRSESTTVTGISREWGAHSAVPREATVLGRAILKALAASREGIPDSDKLSEHGKALLKAAGVRSYDALDSKARAIWIEQSSTNKITFVPCDNSVGLVADYDHATSIRLPHTAEKVGLAALKALNHSTFRS